MSTTLRVAVATPLHEESARLIRAREPRVELLHDPALLPPMRWPADFSGDPAFRRTPSQRAAFEALIDSADALYGIPDVDPAGLARAVRANPRLRWVQTMAAGGGAQLGAAGLSADELDRVLVTTSAGVHAGPLAEFALFGLLAGAKRLPRLRERQARHEWGGRWPMGQLAEQTVLVVGLGSIGRATARLCSALGARVIGTSRRDVVVDGVAEVLDPARLIDVAHRVDAVVVTLPGTATTEGLVSREFCSRLRGATLVSVGRGTVIDEEGLIDALASGAVGFAALDVFAVEPLPADSPLWDMPQVVISPHTAANSVGEERAIAELFADNARRFLDGEPLRNVVDTVEFY